VLRVSSKRELLRLSSGAPRACRRRRLSVTSEMLEGAVALPELIPRQRLRV
jgi:hypothetical protein